MKIVHLSDTHCQLDKIDVPEGDLLIISGDATYRGTVPEISKFNTDLEKIKHKFKHGILFVPGNHDWLFETSPALARHILTNATVLIDRAVTIENIKFYGSPVTPEFCSWAFNVSRGPEIATIWDTIPNDTNVLITHGPPAEILDLCPSGEQVGCWDLRRRIDELTDLKAHLFGHIHFSYGQKTINGVTYVNGSNCTEAYKPTNPPIVIEVS